MLKTFASATLLLMYSFFNIYAQEKLKEIPEHMKIFNEAQKIQDFGDALSRAAYYINRIKQFPDILNYGFENYYASFKIINERMKDDCDGDAVAGMALLYKHKPKMLIISDKPSFLPFQEYYFELPEEINSHAVCIIKKDSKYYSPGISHNGLNSLKDLVVEVAKKLEEKINWRYYWIYDFDLEDLLNADDDISKRMNLIKEGKIE